MAKTFWKLVDSFGAKGVAERWRAKAKKQGHITMVRKIRHKSGGWHWGLYIRVSL